MISIPLFLSNPYPCGYLAEQSAQAVMPATEFELDTPLYSALIAQGFRRSGDQVYKPHCPSCNACIPSRVPVKAFRPDRKQRRCLKQNVTTATVIKPAAFDADHFALYQRYQSARHAAESQEQATSPTEYLQFLGSSWCDTQFVEFRIDGQLAAVAVVDVLEDGLSAVYTFFAPEFAGYSPGVYAVLWQIEAARQLELDYVYLGFWIKNCRKMNYKNQYQPLYGLIDRQWQLISLHSTSNEDNVCA